MSRSLRRRKRIFPLMVASFGVLTGLVASRTLQASIADDYARAAHFLNGNRLVLNEELRPNWIEAGDRFWYRSDGPSSRTFMVVDARRNTKRPAFDHVKLAAALSAATRTRYTAFELPFDRFDYVDGERAVRFNAAGATWECRLREYHCSRPPEPTARTSAITSADGKWQVFVKEHNLFVRDTRSGQEEALTEDAEDGNGYEIGELDTGSVSGLQLVNMPAAFFSPDAKRVLAFRNDLRRVSKLTLTETIRGRPPVLRSFRYPVAEAKDIGQISPLILDLATRARVTLNCAPLPGASLISTLWYPGQSRWGETIAWAANGRYVFFIGEERGYKATTLYAASTSTGAVRTVLTERSATYVNRNPILRSIGDGSELIWSSERDGWNHLYRVDVASGAIKNQITSGAWAIRDLLHVDSRARWIYFTAGGREAGRDPYLRHLYRIGFDGGNLELLTPENADHSVSFSPSGSYLTDTYSRIDSPPVSVVRAADGRLIRTVESADIAPLLGTGWKLPVPFRVLARDGKTEIFGTLFRPTNFDPSRKYPLIDAVYPGPQVIRTAKRFTFSNGSEGFDQALAELGFIVITVDGMGTPFRSKAFRDVSYGNLGDAGGLEDHIAAIRQLGERYPNLDLDRVGIWGFSAGGYASARALLKYPDVYKVAVSLSGNHELRSMWAEWSERFQGYPVDDRSYERQANAPLAANLRGKLLLAYGTLDDVVDPTQTLQLVDALIAANKDFDLLVFPNRSHRLIDVGQNRTGSTTMDPYFVRRLWDYFVTHLLQAEPPREFSLVAPPKG